MKQSPVVHFEMPAKDKSRVSKFYSEVFGWHMAQLGEEMGNYILASTAKTDPKTGMLEENGAINGGFFEYEDKVGFNAPHVVIQVEDLDKTIEDIKNKGGKILSDKMEIQGVGTYVSILDSEENSVGILQPPKAK